MVRADPPPPAPPWTRCDSALSAWLLLSAALLAWPLISAGPSSYLDNPVHLAELYALAESDSAWIDIGFCGAPLGSLHSPLWTGLLTWALRLGLRLEPLYTGLLVAALAAPALALYVIARRSLSRPAAAVTAYLLLIQRPALAGVESPLGGMYPFYLAMALCLGLALALPRARNTPRSLAAIAALVGLIGLSHTFALLVAGLLGALALLRLALLRRWRQGLGLALSLCLGALAAAGYWLQPLLDGQATQRLPQNLSAEQLLRLLLFPHDLLALLAHRPAADWQLGGLDAAPMLLLVLLGLAGVAWQGARLRRGEANDAVALLGGGLAIVLAGLLFFVLPHTDLPWLGPVSWRFLYPLRLGLLLAALPLLARWPALRPTAPPPRLAVQVAVASVLAVAALGWATPLRQQVAQANGAELAEVTQLWQFLRAAQRRDWGRVYLQNTYATQPLQADDGTPRRLSHSHVLALTAHETGVRQLGPFYGVTPFATDWTASAHDNLFGVPTHQPRVYRHAGLWLRRTGCSHLVLADPRLLPGFIAQGLELLHRSGRFAVLQLPRAQWPLVHPGQGAEARVDARVAHRLRVALQVREANGQVRIPYAFSPHWRVVGASPAQLSGDKMGLLVLRAPSPGNLACELLYDPPRHGALLGLGAWLVIAGGLLGAARTHPSARHGGRRGGSTPQSQEQDRGSPPLPAE